MTEYFPSSPTQELIGYQVSRADDGSAIVTMQIGAQHFNRDQIMHGGISALLLDTALGYTVRLQRDASGTNPVATVSLNVQYLAPGRPGACTTRARITGGGKKLVFAEGELTHEDGTIIARATGVFRHQS